MLPAPGAPSATGSRALAEGVAQLDTTGTALVPWVLFAFARAAFKCFAALAKGPWKGAGTDPGRAAGNSTLGCKPPSFNCPSLHCQPLLLKAQDDEFLN